MTAAQAGTWLDASLLAAFFASVLFIIGATFIFPWWKYPLGQALVIVDLLWTLTMLPLVLSLFGVVSDKGVFYVEYFAATLSLTSIAIMWRLWVIYKEQRKERKAKTPDDGS